MERVLERERVEAEDIAQALDVRLGRLGDVEPEEVVALELVAELLLVDLREAGDAQVDPARGIFRFENVGLGRRHAGSVYHENLKIGPAGTGRPSSAGRRRRFLRGLLFPPPLDDLLEAPDVEDRHAHDRPRGHRSGRHPLGPVAHEVDDDLTSDAVGFDDAADFEEQLIHDVDGGVHAFKAADVDPP